MDEEIIALRYIRERATGKPVGPLAPIYRQDWPLLVPPDSQVVRRYMDVWKFEAMVRRSALYFRRCDKFPDPLEGRLSKKGIDGSSKSDLAFRAAYKIADDYDKRRAAQEITRGCMFVNCWNMDARESARMWRDCTSSPEAVSIVSTVEALRSAVRQTNVMISAIRYLPVDKPRIEFSHTTIFFYKDDSFRYEKELRLLRPLQAGEQVFSGDEGDFGKDIPVDIKSLVHRITLHKRVSKAGAKLVRDLAREFCPSASVRRSAL